MLTPEREKEIRSSLANFWYEHPAHAIAEELLEEIDRLRKQERDLIDFLVEERNASLKKLEAESNHNHNHLSTAYRTEIDTYEGIMGFLGEKTIPSNC